MSISLADLTLMLQTSFRTASKEILTPIQASSLIQTTLPLQFDTFGGIEACRGRHALINEYFAAEVFAALGLPVPHSILLEVHLEEHAYLYIRSRIVESNVLRHTTTADKSSNFILNPHYRITERVLTQFLAEAVIQDGDGLAAADAGDNRLVEKDLEIFRVTYDRERASPKLLQESILKETLETIKNAHAIPGIAASLEQERAMIVRLKTLQTSNALQGIFHNTQVQATPEFQCARVQTLETAWNTNIDILHQYYFDPKTTVLEQFTQRENIRAQLADNIIQALSINPKDLSFKDTLLEKLRSPLYHPEYEIFSETLSKDILHNETLINVLVAEERKKDKQLTLSQTLDARLLPALVDIDPQDLPRYTQALYIKKRAFFLNLIEQNEKQQAEILLTFEDSLNAYKTFLREGGIDGLDEFEIKIKKIKALFDQVLESEVARLLNRTYDPSLKNKKSNHHIQEIHRHLQYQLGLAFCKHYFSKFNLDNVQEQTQMAKIERFFPLKEYLNQKTSFNGILSLPQDAIDEHFTIQNSTAIQNALQAYFNSAVYLDDLCSFFYNPFNLGGLYPSFTAEMPKAHDSDHEKLVFLQTQVQWFFKTEAEALQPKDNISTLDLEHAYIACQHFLNRAPEHMKLMTQAVGLSTQNDLQTLNRTFESECEILKKTWEDKLPHIKQARTKIFATERFWTEHFLAKLFPEFTELFPTFSSETSYTPTTLSGTEFFTWQQQHQNKLTENQQRWPELLFSRTNEIYLVNIYPASSEAFNENIAKQCVEYYQALFQSLAITKEPIPEITYIPPYGQDEGAKQKQFSSMEGYLIRIKFQSPQQRQHLITQLCEDCYTPSRDIKIKPDSHVAKHQAQFSQMFMKNSTALRWHFKS